MGNLAVLAVVAVIIFTLALPDVALGLLVYAAATVIIILVAVVALKILTGFA